MTNPIEPEELLTPTEIEVSLPCSDGQVVATERCYANQSITFSNISPTTILGFTLDREVFVKLASGEFVRQHDCDTPDEGLFDGIHWTCPDCGKEWQVQVERWWEEVED